MPFSLKLKPLKSKPFSAYLLAIGLSAYTISGCNNNNSNNNNITSFTPASVTADDRLGENIVALNNNNIVITAPGDSSVETHNGAVYLYNPATNSTLATLKGDAANDRFGETAIVKLNDNRFAIVSADDNVNGISKAGSVTLVDGNTGDVITTLHGDNPNEQFGTREEATDKVDNKGANIGRIINGLTQLSNGHIVIASPKDNVNGLSKAGSVTLLNGQTGEIIKTFSGDNQDDEFGSLGIAELKNGHFVIVSQLDDINGIKNAGSVTLVNSSSGEVVATITGEKANERLGYRSEGSYPFILNESHGVTAINNDLFLIASEYRTNYVSSSSDLDYKGGSVKWVNSHTGNVINTLRNDGIFASNGIVQLSNGHIVIASRLIANDTARGIGSAATLVNSTGNIIKHLSWEGVSGKVLFVPNFIRITALNNNNFVVALPSVSSTDSDNNVLDYTGLVSLVDGNTGEVIKEIKGKTKGDILSMQNYKNYGAKDLKNGQFAIISPFYDHKIISSIYGASNDQGALMLINNDTGDIIKTLQGYREDDKYGSGGLTLLDNKRLVLSSPESNRSIFENIPKRGSVDIIDSDSGNILATFSGYRQDDQLSSGGITAFKNNHFLIASPAADANNIADAGLLDLINSDTNARVHRLIGKAKDDMKSAKAAASNDGKFVVIGMPEHDQGSTQNTGRVDIIELKQ